MKFSTRIIASYVLSLVALTAWSAGPARKIKEVTFSRTPCYGTCPIYKVTLKSDGTLTYVGERFVDRAGTYTATFWARDLERLSSLLDQVGFWNMKVRYTASATDLPSQILTVVSDKGSKTVNEYGASGPAALWAVQTIIDGILQNARDWKKVDKKGGGNPGSRR